MARITRRWAWIVVLAVGVVSAAAFVAHRVAPRARAPVAVTASAPAPAPSAPHAGAPAKGEESAVVAAQPAADPGAIPFAPRVYPSTPSPAPAEAASSPHPGAPNAPPAASASRPLPPGTAVSTIVDRLKAAADSGDRAAACRLGLELQRCAKAPLVTATTRGPVIAQAQCAGVSPADQQSASRYLAQAAQAGSDAARRALAGDASVSPTECGR